VFDLGPLIVVDTVLPPIVIGDQDRSYRPLVAVTFSVTDRAGTGATTVVTSMLADSQGTHSVERQSENGTVANLTGPSHRFLSR
jgi:hypothetical protein